MRIRAPQLTLCRASPSTGLASPGRACACAPVCSQIAVLLWTLPRQALLPPLRPTAHPEAPAGPAPTNPAPLRTLPPPLCPARPLPPPLPRSVPSPPLPPLRSLRSEVALPLPRAPQPWQAVASETCRASSGCPSAPGRPQAPARTAGALQPTKLPSAEEAPPSILFACWCWQGAP